MQIEQKDAIQLVQEFDAPDTCVFADPPYDPTTRAKKLYNIEQDTDFLKKFVETCIGLQSSVVMCGYPSDAMKPLEEAGWKVFSRAGAKTFNKPEYLWVKRSGWMG